MIIEDVVIMDDYLPEGYFEELQNMVTADMFPWHYIHNITRDRFAESLGSFGFDFTMINESQMTHCTETFVSLGCLHSVKKLVGSNNIIKARYDMTLYNPENFKHKPHIDRDFFEPYVSAILYMNETDGETVIYNEACLNCSEVQEDKEYTVRKVIEPKPNRLVLFPGMNVHTGHSPSKHKNRILLNMVFGI